MRKFLLCGAIALLAASFTACSSDPDYEHVTPPEVEVVANSVTGVVLDMQGKAIQGATVKVGDKTATTNADGVYEVKDVVAGTYNVSAAATGMVSAEDKVVVENKNFTQTVIWNATLAKVNTTDVNVTVDGGGNGEVESEALEGNDEGKVDIKVDVPANTVPEDTKISVTPVYTDNSSSVMGVKSRANNDEVMLLGANLTCSNPSITSLDNDIALTFALDGSIATSVETKMLVNGKWVSAPSAVVDGNVTISANKFTTYAIFLVVSSTVTETTTTDALTFKQSEWNNLFGNADMTVGNAEYTYNAGTSINTTASNKLQGLLIEYIARIWGARVTKMTGSYPINVTLPIGTALSIKGAQQKTTIGITSHLTTVKATNYGNVSVQVTTYNRDHNGGSN